VVRQVRSASAIILVGWQNTTTNFSGRCSAVGHPGRPTGRRILEGQDRPSPRPQHHAPPPRPPTERNRKIFLTPFVTASTTAQEQCHTSNLFARPSTTTRRRKDHTKKPRRAEISSDPFSSPGHAAYCQHDAASKRVPGWSNVAKGLVPKQLAVAGPNFSMTGMRDCQLLLQR
jgi:hypothetical protein